MEWLGWAFAAATALLLTIFIFLYLHQKQQAQHQHKKSQKALGKLENEMNRMQKELHHERDIIGLIQEHNGRGHSGFWTIPTRSSLPTARQRHC